MLQRSVCFILYCYFGLTIKLGQCDLNFTLNPVFAIIPWQSNAQSEWCVTQRMVEVILSPDCGSFLKLQLEESTYCFFIKLKVHTMSS